MKKNIIFKLGLGTPDPFSCRGETGGVPEHTGGTNMDAKNMPDPFQALPWVKTGLKHQQMKDFKVKKKSKNQKMGHHEPVWRIYKFKIDITDTPDRFQALPGIETALQDKQINVLRYLIEKS